MTVRVLFFSLLQDITGAAEIEEHFEDGDQSQTWRVSDLLERLMERHEAFRAWESRILIAVDREYADRDAPLADGQEIAVMPPVQGG